jgi:WD40 repeat protein/tRNA A-37 threonylcarbamoyl transferase component Bud32
MKYDRDELAPTIDVAGHTLLDPATADDTRGDDELDDLRFVIDMLDRAGPRMGSAATRPAEAPGELNVPSLLGDFTIVRAIGRGGMGVVYEAVQKSLNRRVALKILPSTSADDSCKVKRFLVEAQAAACLQHPHIVPVHMVGSANGLHYYAMQFIEGRTLADLIIEARRAAKATASGTLQSGREPSSPRVAAELGRQAALALHFAHEHGIIHRDVKPSNLLVEDSGWLWVSDFGLARIAGQADLTLSGAVMGTLRYMSPEQSFGSRGGVDHRADVYSLGATLYELLTLRPIFQGDDRVGLLRRIAEEEPPAPRRIDPAIPRDLETIVRKAMAKVPDERYATALELAGDLGRFLQNRPIVARPPGAVDRATKWVRRHKPAVTAATAVLVLFIVGLAGGAVWWNGMLRRHNSELSRALKRAEENESATRRLWYDSQIRLAQEALASGQIEFAQETVAGLAPEASGRELRGFEWHYLRRLCCRDLSLLSKHERQTTAITVSPDGRTLVTGHSHGVMVFWDLDLGRERARVQAHTGLVDTLSFSPSGRVLASLSTAAGSPSQVKLWDPSTARPRRGLPQINARIESPTFAWGGRILLLLERDLRGDVSKDQLVFWDLARDPEHPVRGAAPVACSRMAYSPQGEALATSATSGNVTLRDATTGEARKTLPKSFPWITELAVSPDGHTLAVADRTAITFWDIQRGCELGSVAVTCSDGLTFSPDGNRLASRADTHQAIVLIENIRPRPRQVVLDRPSGKGLQFDFSSDGKMLAAGGIGGTATVWDTTSGRTLAKFVRDGEHLGRVVFAPGGESLFVPTADGPIRSWHFAKKPEPIDHLAGHKAEVWGLAYTPDGSTLISSADDHTIRLWDAHDGRLRSTLKGHGALVSSVAVSPNGNLLASAGFDNTVRLWDLPGGSSRAVLHGHTDRVRAVAFSPDGRIVASASSDRTVRVWDVDRGEPILAFDGHTNAVRALASDPSGAILVSASDDRSIRGIKLCGGGEAFCLALSHANSAVAFSPDGALLASADDGGNLTFWDTATWSKQRSVKGSNTPIWGLAFSPDGRTLAAACGDAKVRLWDPLTGQVMLVLDGHSERVNAVAFAADGKTLASTGHDGSVRLWKTEYH